MTDLPPSCIPCARRPDPRPSDLVTAALLVTASASVSVLAVCLLWPWSGWAALAVCVAVTARGFWEMARG